MKSVEFHPDAAAELDAAVAYYEAAGQGLGLDFQDEVERAVEGLQRNPERWPIHADFRMRKYRLKRFPYNLFYLELDERLWIAAVAHQKRKPGYWLDRNAH